MEADLILDSARLVYSRWQVQCKNTSRVSLDDVTKEVGLTHFLKSNVIVAISTGRISADVRICANKEVMADSNLSIVLLSSMDVAKTCEYPVYIVECFNREAENAMKLKSLEIPG